MKLNANMYDVNVMTSREDQPKKSLEPLRKYLAQTLGVSVQCEAWPHANQLPPFLHSLYAFAKARIGSQEVLLFIDRSSELASPGNLRKHHALLQNTWPGPRAFVTTGMTSSMRKRLIEKHVPFVVPGNQLYLPDLGLDLREHYKQVASHPDQLRPASQQVLFHFLLHRTQQPMTAKGLQSELDYSAMTFSRAFDELDASELTRSEKVGRERLVELSAAPREVWTKAQPKLINPVRQTAYVDVIPQGPAALCAGLDALSSFSMIQRPRVRVVAWEQSAWNRFQLANPKAFLDDEEDAALQVECWVYPPRSYGAMHTVDPLSLYAALRTDPDERVQAALNDMLESLPW